MPQVIPEPPASLVEPVIDILHDVPVSDPYRWLEEQNSPKTRAWLDRQTRYARAYLDAIPGRDRIRQRVREFLGVETYDSLQKSGNRYFFRKRLPDQEQHSIYAREGPIGRDDLLLDPATRARGNYTSVKPLCVSPDGRLLLYQVKEGGERTATFEILDIETRKTLPGFLPRGYLRGFAFAPDSKSFYYVHEALNARRPFYQAAYQHALGTSFNDDAQVFYAGEEEKLRLHLISGKGRLGFLMHRFLDKPYTDFHVWSPGTELAPRPVIRNASYRFGPILVNDGILALTDLGAPNRRIVSVTPTTDCNAEFADIIPECEFVLRNWTITAKHLILSYIRQTKTVIVIFTYSGEKVAELISGDDETFRVLRGSLETDEFILETESFFEPIRISCASPHRRERVLCLETKVPLDRSRYRHAQIWYPAKDGTNIPMFLLGRSDVFESGERRPAILTSYGGYGTPITPKFSIFAVILMELGCLFALPSIRGGSEFGFEWHSQAKRRKRQTAFDDFLSAAEWLIATGRTTPDRLAIFGGSNSGLLVGAALTQRPELFRAVVCIAPLLDMLRYHLFDNAHVWKEEFGTADDPDDFRALLGYSPYHQVRDGAGYPAALIVSGDCDNICNPLHARKMTARLQAASRSAHPILLDYQPHRGHSPVLPLSEIQGLTDRLAFLCDQLHLLV